MLKNSKVLPLILSQNTTVWFKKGVWTVIWCTLTAYAVAQTEKLYSKQCDSVKSRFLITLNYTGTDALLQFAFFFFKSCTHVTLQILLEKSLAPGIKKTAFWEIHKQINWIPKPISATVLLIYAHALHSPMLLSCCHIPEDSYQHGNCQCKTRVPSLDLQSNKVSEMRCKETSLYYQTFGNS